jgi:hypothetical protein
MSARVIRIDNRLVLMRSPLGPTAEDHRSVFAADEPMVKNVHELTESKRGLYRAFLRRTAPMRPNGTLEREVLLRVCRPLGSTNIDQILSQPLDWKLLVSAAAENGVTPLLYLALKDRTSVPEPIRAELLDAWVTSVAHSLRLTSALVEILGHLRGQGVRALAYKGPALAMSAYGNATMRSFWDLDIIVRHSDLAATKAALEDMGYRCTLSGREDTYFLREQYHLLFAGGDPKLSIEIHWAITPMYWPFPLDSSRLWNGTNSVELIGAQVPTLDRELTLLAICAHGAKDCWARLGLVCDIAGLLARSPDLDWHWITHEAAAMGRTRVLLLGLSLAASLLEAPVPDPFLVQAQADRVVVMVAREIEEHLFSGEIPVGLRLRRYAWLVWNRWSDRMGYLRHAIGDPRQIPRRIARKCKSVTRRANA